MSQKSPKLLIILTILLFSAVASAAGFLVLKDKKIDFGKIFSKKTKDISASVSGILNTQKLKQAAMPQEFMQTQADAIIQEKTNTDNLTDALSAIISEQAIATGLDPTQASGNLEQAFAKQLGQTKNLFSLPEISDSELNISSDNSPDAQKEYTKTLSKILATYFPSAMFEKSDIEVAQKAIEEKNFEELDQYIEAYKILYEKVKVVPTPPDWLEIQKEQLGLFSVTRQLLEAYRNVEVDAVRAIIAAEKYPEILKQAYELAITIEDKMALLK